MPNRRVAIQQLVLIWAGVAFLPACLHNERTVSIPLKKIQIDPDDETMLAGLSETILPKTNTPGARDLSAHLFALKMVDDCFTKQNQEKFISGMKDFEAFVQKTTGRSFTENGDSERRAIVAELDRKKTDEDGISFFYNSTKKLTIQAYTTCEYYLTKIRGYKMIPGKFQGCIPLQTA
jgi:Gluconate 2-dehydrogenase subunit 3